MVHVKELIAAALVDDDQVFVFPSEIAADFWRREALRLGERQAVWGDRFLSWDRFKEESFQLSQRAAPVNRLIRLLFAAELLEENSRTPFLSGFINREFAENSAAFLRGITSVLPELKRYREVVERAPRGAVAPETAADLDLLWERYSAFLSDNGLFEPSFDQVDLSKLTRIYHLFFPEVIEDWEEARPHLDFTAIRPVATPVAPGSAISRFQNSVQELRRLFGAIRELLDAGTDPGEIAVTVPRLERWESTLRREAALMDIPLDLRQGRTLSQYPEIRLFTRLADCEAGGYTVEQLKALFLNRAFPWRHRRAGEALIRWGIDHGCAGRYESGGRRRDSWIEKLTAASSGDGHARSLLEFYRGFVRDVASLLSSRSLDGVRTRLQRFITSWLDTDRWGVESRRVFQFALNALNDLSEAHGRVPGVSVRTPYALWLSVLGERLYVPRSHSPGIAVYPYRVSAGIASAHHFLLGATQAATQVDWRPLSFLRDDERERLRVEDRSATEEFLALYLSSGESVAVSCSNEDEAGIQLPPGYFVARGAVNAAEVEGDRERDAYLAEVAVWTGERALPPRLFATQQRGAAYFEGVGFGRREQELTRVAIGEAGLTARITAELSDAEGRLKVSATRLDRFWECPFGYLFTTGLGLEERSYSVEWQDPRLIGSLMHETLSRLFEAIRESTGRFEEDALDRYRTLLAEAVAAVYAEREAAGEEFAPPVWNSLRPHLIERFEQFLEAEAKLFGGLAIEGLEETVEELGEGLRLEGRIDRVSSGDDGALIVDYKRRNRVRKSDLTAALEAQQAGEAAASLQIPFYVRLLESQGRSVERAAYYSVEEGKYQIVYDAGPRPAWLDRGQLEELLDRTGAAIAAMERRIRAGQWMAPDPANGCEQCRLRPVCRMKYAVR